MNRAIEFCTDMKTYNRGINMLNGGAKLACVGIVLTAIGAWMVIKGKRTVYDTIDPKVIFAESNEVWEKLYEALVGDD